MYDHIIKQGNLDDLIQLVNLPIGGTLLDAGGGTGRIAQALSNLVHDIIVVDASMGMLRQAGEKDGLLLTCAQTETLPFPEKSFDRVIMVDALHHVNNHQKTAHELWRVLKSGGRIVIEEPNITKLTVRVVALLEKLALMRSHFLSPPRIARLFRESGAKIMIHEKDYTAWIIINKD